MSTQKGFPVKLVKKRATPEEIIMREGRTRIYGQFYDGINSSTLIQIGGIPNYNRNSTAVIDAKAKVSVYGDKVKVVITGNTDGSTFYSDPGSGVRLMSGQTAEFDFSEGIASEGAQLYISAGDGVTPIITNVIMTYKTLTNDLRFDADRSLGWIGDSISGPTTNSDLLQNDYHNFATRNWLMNNSLIKETFRLCNVTSGGKHSSNYNDLLNKSGQNSNPCDLSIEFYQMGMNDHAQNIPIITYKANIRKWIKHRQLNYPGIVLVLLGVTPAQGLARQNGLDAYRTAMAECVLEEQALWPAGDPMRNRIIGIDLGHCFDRTIPARFAISDGNTGDALHPGDVTANFQMFQKICEGIDFDTPPGQLGKNFITTAAPNGLLPAGGLKQRGIFDLLKAI